MSEEEQVKAESQSTQESEEAEVAKAKIQEAAADDRQENEPLAPPQEVDEEHVSAADKQQEEAPTTNGTEEAPVPILVPRPSDPRLSVPRKVPSTPPASVSRSPLSTPSFLGTTTATRPGYPGTSVGLPEGISVPMGVDSKLLQGRLLDTLKQLPNDLITDALNEYDDALQNKGGSIRNQGAYLYGVIKRYVNVQERAASGNADHVMGKELTPEVTERLDRLVTDGFCSQEEMNDKVKSKIRMLSEKDALFAIEELSSVERGSIRNFSSYFMGILNRYMRGDTSTGGPARPRRDDHKTSRYDNYPQSDRHRGRSPDSDRDYRRRDDDRSGRYGDRDSRHRRDRSRDRYDDDRGRGDYGRDDRSYRDRPPRYDDRTRNQSSSQYSQYGPGAPPPPPPPRQSNMPSLNAYAPQPQQQQQLPQQQQMYMAPTQQQMFQQQVPQQFVPQQQGGTSMGMNIPGSSFVPQQQQPMMSQQTPQMGQQSFMSNIQQQPVMTSMQQQPMPGSYAAPSPASAFQPQQQQQTSTIPADILGLADKAASAVQALQASRLSAPVASMSAPPLQMMQMPMQAQPMQFPGSFSFSNASSQPAIRRGRATATMGELPVMVQYAVQNLQATGHVDGTLDEGILGMINELPEPQALAALQRFASIDTASMRNKTAYLAGVLRRELEKIQKR